MHHDEDILILANSWDVGSSRLVEACGYRAVGTTSMGIAASRTPVFDAAMAYKMAVGLEA
jgi:2-methylisocitrate lyase-like PEP mutase family enzyme